jgi:hypothetical protein
MKIQSRLIYKSQYTCFQSPLPVYFYGLSNGKVVVLFASNKTDFAYDTALKWIMAEHIDFVYDFETSKIITTDNDEIGIDEFMLFADNLEQRIKVMATFGNFLNKTEAHQYFNINSYYMLSNQNQEKYEVEYF